MDDESQCIYSLGQCLINIKAWMDSNRLRMNNGKTEFILLESSISLQQNQILLGTQAFTSPPDMASSGVWENVILPKTPTFGGVSGILYLIIFLNFAKYFCQIFVIVDRWYINCYYVDRC